MNAQEQRAYTELLVVRCQLGEREGLQLLVELWQRPLLGFAVRYLEQETDACDAVQETWVAVIKGLSGLENPSLFVSWLFRILTNKCIDLIRQKHKEACALTRPETASEPSGVSVESARLSQAIGRLSDEQKTLIRLRFEQGLQIAQIAAMLNLVEGTVKSRLHRALAALRELMEVQS